MNDTIISVENLSKQYQTEQASGINNISVKINRGEVLAIIGESGSGKSTLLKTIYGLLKADEGNVYFEGKRVKGPDEQLIPGHKQMKMVTQDFSLNIYATVFDNIASQLSNTDLKSKREKTIQIMEHLRISHLQSKKIIALSGGEQQRVAIAKALVSDTQVLLLDEPFSQVDALLKNQLRADIKRLVADTGITVIMVSHDPADGLFLADQLLIIKDGEVLQTGKPAAVYQSPAHAYTAKMLGNAVVLNRTDAEKIGLQTKQEFVAFYPEWVEAKDSPEAAVYTIKDIYFKGFYEELLLERNGVYIRSIRMSGSNQEIKDQLKVHINRFLSLDA